MKYRIKHSEGYWLVLTPNHPLANHVGYVPEHRLVVEASIGRYINPIEECVHHKNEIRTDNRLCNLELVSMLKHRRIHAGWKIKGGKWYKPCSGCERLLPFDECFYKRSDGGCFSKCKDCAKKQALVYMSKKKKKQAKLFAKRHYRE